MKKLFLLFLYTTILFAQYEDTRNRGMYFSKKAYTDSNIPAFAQSKSKLPQPVLTNNPELIDLYWRAWELAFDHYRKPPKGSPFVSNFIDEAFSFSVFQWDTIFMIMFARYANSIFPAIQSLDNFYCRQYENGYICREIQEADGEDYIYEGRVNTINPPLFGWAEIESYKLTGDKSRFKIILPALEKYAEWLDINRKKPNTTHDLYWQTGLGSGMDNTPRNGSAWVCMSSQMKMFYEHISFISKEIGEDVKADKYKTIAAKIGMRINKLMWNEEDGMYYDLDDNGNQIKVKTIASFWPLLADLCDEHKAEKLMANLKDPDTFWRTIPFPSLAANDKDYKPYGDYWLGGVWAPTNLMVIKGLDKFSFNDKHGYEHAFREFATNATMKYLEALSKIYKETGTIWENCAPESYMRGLPAKPDFVGWSGSGPIMLLIENILGIQANAAKNEVVWYLNRIDEHGIKNLEFGETTASLICQKRIAVNKKCELTITADKPFTLRAFNWSKNSQVVEVKKGITKLIID